ncbi:Hypothetical protein GLP15_522 [Giardia lamblia P15]|uniref:Uncharacterized protein n=1 Tax=Giardia intestinalis (strain P15) TaxID=658858 RepID=E1F6F3_GIAIA|nr:Hypothetical protein GLP15_522 [Giardia lamblia P15]
MHTFYEQFGGTCSKKAAGVGARIAKSRDGRQGALQHILLAASMTLAASIGLLSTSTYFSLGKANPVSGLNSSDVDHLSNSIRFVISADITPTYNAILKLVGYLCIGIFLCAVVLLCLLFAYWVYILPSWNIFYNLGIAFVVTLEYLGISIHLSIISSPQINRIISFPRTVLFQAVSMATAIVLFIAASLFSDTMHK